MKRYLIALSFIICHLTFSSVAAQIQTNAGVQYLQCMPKDVSTDFSDLSNTYFLADSLTSFDAAREKDWCSGNVTVCHHVRLST